MPTVMSHFALNHPPNQPKKNLRTCSNWIQSTFQDYFNLDLTTRRNSLYRHSAEFCHSALLFQVLIKPKPVFQTAVVSEQTRQLVTETLQQVTRSAESAQGQTQNQDGSSKDEPGEVPQGSAHGTFFFPQRL